MTKKPKILLYDVETSPVLAYVWNIGRKTYIDHKQIKRGQKFDIICICWKWAGERQIHSLDWGLHDQDSSEMIEKFSEIAEQADLVLGHNVDKFDIRQINTQRLLHGQGPINWPTSEDTLKQFRKYFYLPSYKLDYISNILTGSGKARMEFRDWIDIIEDKSEKALNKMIKYCKRDVQKLEEIWDALKPFAQPKAHMGLIQGGSPDGCPRCASLTLLRDGFKITAAGRYQRYQCKKCGHKFRSRRSS